MAGFYFGFLWAQLIVISLLVLLGWVQSNDEHLCEHPIGKPYHFQAVTRTVNYLYVIESDNLYQIPVTLIRPNHCRVKLMVDDELIQCQKWYEIEWIAGYFKRNKKTNKLLNFVVFTESYFTILNLTHRYENADSAYLQFVFPRAVYHYFNRTIHNGADLKKLTKLIKTDIDANNVTMVMDGLTNQKGLYIELHAQRVLYSNLFHVLETRVGRREIYQRYFLQITAYKRVKFVPMLHNPPITKDLIINNVPFGFIDKNDLYLLDALTKSVYQLPFVQLEMDSSAEILIKKNSMKEFFQCSNDQLDDDPDNSGKRTKLILLIVVAVVVVTCIGLALFLVILNVKFRKHKHNAGHKIPYRYGGYRFPSMGRLRMRIPFRRAVRHQTTTSPTTSHHHSPITTTPKRRTTTTHTRNTSATKPVHDKAAKHCHPVPSPNHRNTPKQHGKVTPQSESSTTSSATNTLTDTSPVPRKEFEKPQPQQPQPQQTQTQQQPPPPPPPLPIIKLKPLIQEPKTKESYEFMVSKTKPSATAAALTYTSNRKISTQNSLSTAIEITPRRPKPR